MQMTEDQKLAHGLKIKFGLGPYEPSAGQLAAIKRSIQALKDQGIQPTHSDWEHAVYQYCPGAGTCGYSGIDNSDLNALLMLAQRPPAKR
ncbi:hypothetical protein [Pseudomonas syringae group genomosp. 3]|jgi:hypothetical protein|uniref:hypothetical protein n=1 Tax=Pseudomonas syringae group genomosp. 3 TaxID=251701 RepID=UPI0005C8CC91|nr:hypothetical protein [Pseudomonas syringae group genomosp. 3]